MKQAWQWIVYHGVESPGYLPPRTANDSGSVEHWQFNDGDARVLERWLGFSEPVAWLYGGEQLEIVSYS